MPFVRNIFVLCTFLVGFAISAHAQTGEEWTGEKAGREKKAGQWRDEFGKLNAQIPTLSPAEERWLKTEIEDTIADAGGKYTSRSIAAMDSREYEIRVAKPHVRDMINALDQIIRLIPLGNQRLEATQWKVAALLIDKQFWQAVDGLVRRKVVQGRINGVDQLYHETHGLWAQQILNGIVFRYLGTSSLP